MFQGQIETISNRAHWVGPFCQIVLDDGTIANILNTDIGFDCAVTISGNGNYQALGFDDYYDHQFCQSPIVLGTIANGRVIASQGDDGPGFQWTFTPDDLSGLRPGTYRFGIKTAVNGVISDLVDGSVTVVQGNTPSVGSDNIQIILTLAPGWTFA